MPLALLLVIIDVMLVVHAAHTERAHPWACCWRNLGVKPRPTLGPPKWSGSSGARRVMCNVRRPNGWRTPEQVLRA